MFNNNPLIYLARKDWEFSAGNRKNVVLFLVLFALSNLVSFTEPIVLAQVVNVVQKDLSEHGGITYGEVLHACRWLSLMVLSGLVFWACHGPARVLEQNNAFLVRGNFRRKMLDGILRFPMQWHVDHHTGDTIDRVEKGANAIVNFAEDSFMVIGTLSNLVGSFIALVYFNPRASFAVVLTAFLAGALVIRFDKILVPQYRILSRSENKISEKVIDVITNIGTIIILRVEKNVMKAIVRKIMEPFELFRKNRRISETKWFFVGVINSLTTVWVLGSFLYYHSKLHTAIAIGTFIALYQYVRRINDACFRFTGMYSDIVKQRARLENAEEIANDFYFQEKIQTTVLNGKWRELKIRNLSFSYHADEGADLRLENVSMTIKRGQRTALIGSTGSGKSTLLKVVRDLYDPRTLDLYLDGRRLSNGFKAISPEIALVQQDPEIFSTTVAENIKVWADWEMADILKHTDIACFTNVAEGLPKKWDSMMKEKGVNLSGGEKQRLALARGLLASEDKAIVLLDEPTSSVDVANEQVIFENIFRAFSDKAIICSLHSLHLLPMFDQIHMFEDGKIIASGTFEQIMDFPAFRGLWEDFIKNRDKIS
jgi:ABC-type multidrug transport system fused ATPase/permease subunit